MQTPNPRPALRAAARIELLETRIAPAVFFVHGNNLTITDSAGADATASAAETAAETATLATAAVLLSAGDSLVFDLNGDNDGNDAGDTLLATVSAGQAMFFFNDRNALSPPGLGSFQPVELTGVAFGNGFVGTIEVAVNGPIVAALDATGAFTSVSTDADPQMENVLLQNTALAGLTVKGRVTGAVVGGTLSNVTLRGVSPGALGSAESLANSQAAAINAFTFTFNAGDAVLVQGLGALLSLPDGASGGSISNVNLADGVTIDILAGPGGAGSAAVPGGRGGNITGLNAISDQAFTISAGDGGGGLGARGGGAGGSLSNLKVQVDASVFDAMVLRSGVGGDTLGSGVPGAGGAISSVEITAGGTLRDVTVRAGSGGVASGNAPAGGAGGAITGVVVKLLDSVGDDASQGSIVGGLVEVSAGAGGSAVSGTGGAGGSNTGSQVRQFNRQAEMHIVKVFAGEGGLSTNGAGGAGGAITGTRVSTFGHIGMDLDGSGAATITDGHLEIRGGDGGAGRIAGGHGGLLRDVSVLAVSLRNESGAADSEVTAGNGGALTNATVATHFAGNGGALSAVTVQLGSPENDFDIISGQGGNVSGALGSGGIGGDASGVLLTLTGAGTNAPSFLRLAAGTGGNGPLTSGVGFGGSGGRGGAVLNSTVKILGEAGTVFVNSGEAGGSSSGFTAGAGGAINGVVVEVPGGVSDRVEFRAGSGGSVATSGTGAAGPGGAVLNSIIKAAGEVGRIVVTGGDGGRPGTGSGNGAAGGSVQNFSIQPIEDARAVALGDVEILGGAGGDATRAGAGGTGGNVSGLNVALLRAERLLVAGGSGGDGASVDIGGAGGAGGLVSTVVASVAQLNDIYSFRGGAGGDVPLGNFAAGVGGSVGAVDLRGQRVAGGEILGGDGGQADAGTAGRGGNLSFRVTVGQHVSLLQAEAGDGGSGRIAGMGGSVVNSSLWASSSSSLNIFAGRGGNGVGNAPGGAGGDLLAFTATVLGQTGSYGFFAGAGGTGGASGGDGGRGGRIDAVRTVTGDTAVRFQGGSGGDVLGPAGRAGAGGDITNSSAVSTGEIRLAQFIAGPAGGNTAGADARGGGNLRGLRVQASEINTAIFDSGQGGSASGGNAGAGGVIENVTVTAFSTPSGIGLESGDGGNVVGGNGNGGAGGMIKNVVMAVPLLAVLVDSGDGGDAGIIGDGGQGGDLVNLTATVSTRIEADLETGNGGDANSTAAGSGNGGRGGNVINGNFAAEELEGEIEAGIGGDGFSADGATAGGGGQGGSVVGGRYLGSVGFGELEFEAGNGGVGERIGGKGGSVSGVQASAALIEAEGGGGGAGGTTAGSGGSVIDSTFTVGRFVQRLRAGDAGALGTAGVGGNIARIVVLGTGQIGDTTQAFGISGGIFAGRGTAPELNGAVTDINAGVIASIMAGNPAANAITSANAVKTIANILAARLGNDRNGDLRATDILNTDFGGPGSSDTLVDGILVIDDTAANRAALAGKPLISGGFVFFV